MTSPSSPDRSPPPEVLAAFGLGGARTRRLGAGHINDTWRAGDCVVQRINAFVFSDPHAVAARATAVARELRAGGAVAVPRPVGHAVTLSDGSVWRAYRYIVGRTPTGQRADERCGEAFGCFARGLAHIDAAAWPVAIPRFHDFGHRVRQLRQALDDPLRTARRETDRALALIHDIRARREYRAWRRLPPRIVHNDAKQANLVRQPSGVLAIVDLDTVGSGSLLFDLGELIRSTVREDAAGDTVSAKRIAAVRRGYLRGWDAELRGAEADALPIAGLTMTAENAIRFLADYLRGDRYFAIDHPRHNLERARAQLALAELLFDLEARAGC